jgi:hypothetical protein
MAENNPLRKYFRQPAIHIRLPSEGKFYPPGTLDMPPNGEIPVYPMTAVDEITSRTPDALFNGSAVMDVIQSCIPNIKNPWAIPTTDIATLFIAVRLASYGHDMEINSTCPSCGHNHDLNLDLRIVLDNIGKADYEKSVTSGDLTFYFSPMNYQQINDNTRGQFEDQKLVQMINDNGIEEEEKMRRLGEAFKRITELTIKSIANSIAAIKTPDAMVTDRANIEDFLHNCPKGLFDQVRDHAIALREATDIRPVAVTCDECQFQYQQSFTLDMTNFFASAS